MDAYGGPVQALIRRAAQQDLPATLPFGKPVDDQRAGLVALTPGDIGGGRPVRDADALVGLRAGLWLLFDCMAEAHDLAQQIEDTTGGAYWHAIVHRREPDPGNAKYWFRHIGAHAIFPALLADARREVAAAGAGGPPGLAALAAADTWRPDRFVDLATGSPAPAARAVLLAIQRHEWRLLFDHEWRATFQQG